MDAVRKFRCATCGIVDAAGCEQSGCPERPELATDSGHTAAAPDSAQRPAGRTLDDAIKAAHRIMNYPAWPRLPLPVQREVRAILFILDRVPDSAQVAGKDGA